MLHPGAAERGIHPCVVIPVHPGVGGHSVIVEHTVPPSCSAVVRVIHPGRRGRRLCHKTGQWTSGASVCPLALVDSQRGIYWVWWAVSVVGSGCDVQ